MRWLTRRLDELGVVARGKSKHRPRDAAHLYGGPYPFIQTGDVKHSSLYINSYTQTYSDAGVAQSKLWPKGTLCITIAANIAETAILGIDACFPDSVIGFTPDENKCDVRFIKYKFDVVKHQYQRFSQGAAQDNLSLEKLLSLNLIVPPVETQRRIGDILSAYDDLIENNLRRIALLEESGRLLYKEWFVRLRFPGYEHTRFANGVPESWEKKTLSEVSSYINRGIAPHYDDEAHGIVINQKCIRNGMLDMSLARRQSREYPEVKQVQLGDVLINSTGEGTLGRVAQVKSTIANCTVDSHVTIVRPASRIPVHYFGMVLTSLEPRFSVMGRGATNQTELSRAAIAETPILIPDAPISMQFEEAAELTFSQITNLTAQNMKLKQARDRLLPRLMSGEIEV